MDINEFLAKDNSYLLVPHNSQNARSNFLYDLLNKRKIKHSFVGAKGNQREAYERGVKIGYHLGVTSHRDINNLGLSKEEYSNFITLLPCFGYRFEYTMAPSVTIGTSVTSGLNICKDMKAIEAGLTVSDTIKQQIYEILKNNSNINLWRRN